MYSPPTTPTDEQRALTAQSAAADALGITVTGPRQWGYQGRTLGQQAHHLAHGACWLRLISAPAGQANGKLWDGTEEAAAAFPTVRKPALHALHDLHHGGLVFRAELSEFIASPTCSPEPVLRTELNLTPAWWTSLRTDLDTIAATHTTRVAVRQEWISRAVPQHARVPAPDITNWATAHGDFHFANITRQPVILDWEGFGSAPLGYDAAMLYAYSLLTPATAATIRRELPVLNTPVGNTALLIVAADLLQSCSRGNHPELAAPLRALVASIT
ncbi:MULTISPECIES: phosphotransferase [Streptomyces]|uniref:Aminoglycoside phosphotransferase domain-containing protein n=1 Tax=Streptomyces dengpaensis TaxID=2049881 RepID=A0ABN5HTY4_9ACTN|nr:MULTISPECIES: hypothetical protein [Streptomyces]AVH54612.1 hypothetical protein C4B68_00815 [Streptomyces dengpaensis]PIB00344.1 hypothetical protein B1C81_38355 [Streptomyces sp. HG99]